MTGKLDNAVCREMTANKRAAGVTLNISGFAVQQDAYRLMAMIPPDTRSITGRVFGDPLPGRRALDKRNNR